MIVGIVSDVHGNAPALAAVLRRLRTADVIIFLGDAVGYYPCSTAVCRALRQRCTFAIAGNHDRYLVAPPPSPNRFLQASMTMVSATVASDERAWLASLPHMLETTLDGVNFLAVHGSPWDAAEGYVYPDRVPLDRFAALSADVVLLGHTHRPMCMRAGQVLVVNPGSVGQPRDGNPQAAYGVFDTETRTVQLARIAYKPAGLLRRTRRWYNDQAHVQLLASYLTRQID